MTVVDEIQNAIKVTQETIAENNVNGEKLRKTLEGLKSDLNKALAEESRKSDPVQTGEVELRVRPLRFFHYEKVSQFDQIVEILSVSGAETISLSASVVNAKFGVFMTSIPVGSWVVITDQALRVFVSEADMLVEFEPVK